MPLPQVRPILGVVFHTGKCEVRTKKKFCLLCLIKCFGSCVNNTLIKKIRKSLYLGAFSRYYENNIDILPNANCGDLIVCIQKIR